MSVIYLFIYFILANSSRDMFVFLLYYTYFLWTFFFFNVEYVSNCFSAHMLCLTKKKDVLV